MQELQKYQNIDIDFHFSKTLKILKYHKIDLKIVGLRGTVVKGIVDFLKNK